MRERGRRWVLDVALVGVVLAACTSGPELPASSPSWGSRAQQYLAAVHDAQAVGYSNLAQFLAPDAEVDYGLIDYDGVGRGPAIQAMRDLAQDLRVTLGGRDPSDTSTWTFDEPAYVSLDGAVDVARLTTASFTVPTAWTYALRSDGIRSAVWAGSVQAGEEYEVLARPPLERIGRAYVAAWGAGDPEAVASLYAAEAQVDDSLTGVRLRGSTDIGRAAGQPWAAGGLQGAVLHEIPQGGGPAIYVNAESTGGGPIDRMVLLLHVEEVGGCPGDVAVSLHLDGSTILSEQRYHRVDSPTGCWAGTPSGWWDHVRIPNPRAILRTATMNVSGLDVAIWNGTPDLPPLLTWGLQRFADAGLPAPIPTSVTFLGMSEDPWADYGFEEGSTAPDLALALPASLACPPEGCTRWPLLAKAAVLHQLAHQYLADPDYPRWADPLVGPSRMAPFLAEHDLTWLDPSREWDEQASQLAAETVSWGLMDEPYVVDARMGTPTCAELAADFALLTGSTPEPRSCAETTGESTSPSPAPSRAGGSTEPGTIRIDRAGSRGADVVRRL